jgi:hypothetical protein
MPVVARDLLDGGARTYGLLLGGFGIGAMLGALFSATLRARLSSDTLLRILSGLAFVAMLSIAQSVFLATTLLALVLAGAVWTLGLANFNIAIQLSSPRWVTGRMLATYQTVAFAGMAFGSWGWGVLAERLGIRESLTIAAFSALVSLVVARWAPVSVASLGSLDPHAGAEVAPPKVDIHPASGPIVVTITYRVPPENGGEFIDVINELGRIRRRDGARRWSACQDIDDPQYWVERFESPTWLDYLRRQTRPTLADQGVRERMRQLVLGERGTVRRQIERPSGSEPLGAVHSRPEPIDDPSSHA